MCAITDHDTFNYNMYKILKEEENKIGTIKKVLPGVEFSVNYQDDKDMLSLLRMLNITNIQELDKEESLRFIEEKYERSYKYLKDISEW